MQHKTESRPIHSHKPVVLKRRKQAQPKPRKYIKGRPVYTEEDLKDPNFFSPYPSEEEWVEEIHAALKKKKK